MVRPRREIGTLELLVRLRFEPPASGALGLLAAYALTPPPGEVTDAHDDTLCVVRTGMYVKVARANGRCEGLSLLEILEFILR